MVKCLKKMVGSRVVVSCSGLTRRGLFRGLGAMGGGKSGTAMLARWARVRP